MTVDDPRTVGGLTPDAFSSLFQAVGGLRNRRALLAMLGCTIAGVLVAGLFSLLATRLGFAMALLGGLAMFVASATGINAAGVLLMDQARGVPSRTPADAVVHGLKCIPKFILLALLLFGVALAVFVALAVVYFVCKVPWLGPLLFVVVFPLSVLVSGLAVCGLFLCMFLALPAIWEGATITRALAQTLAIARSRGVEAILLLAVVGALAGVVAIIVFGVLFVGLVPSAGLAASILGGDGAGGMLGMMRSGSEMAGAGVVAPGGANSHALAAGIGGAVLWALAGSLVALVYLLGLNLVYLRLTEGLDAGAAQASLKAGLDDAKRRAADLGQKAGRVAEQARDKTGDKTPDQARTSGAASWADAMPRTVPNASAAPAAVKAPACPTCLSAVGAGDVFCGVCGHRLS